MAAAIPAVQSPAPPRPRQHAGSAMGDLFENYDPQGAMDGLFAPAYIQGYAPSEKAVAEWQAQNHADDAGDARRRCGCRTEWTRPQRADHGERRTILRRAARIPNNLRFVDRAGHGRPGGAAALAQGGQYDMDGAA